MEGSSAVSPEWTQVRVEEHNHVRSSGEEGYKSLRHSRQGRNGGKRLLLLFFSLAALGFASFVLVKLYARLDGNDRGSHTPVKHRDKRQAGTCQVDMCLTQECIHVASSILSSMDASVDPCDDFFQYTCGTWIKENKHKAGEEELFYAINHNTLPEKTDLILSELLRQSLGQSEGAKDPKPYRNMFVFYGSCLQVGELQDEDYTEALTFLKDLEEFHIGRHFDPNTWDLTKAVLELMKLNGVPLLDILIQIDVQEPTRYAVDISPPRRYGLIPSLIGPQIRSPGIEYLRLKGRRALFGDLSNDPVMREIVAALQQSIPVRTNPSKGGPRGRGSLSEKLTGPSRNLVGKPSFNVLPTDDVLEKNVPGTTHPSTSSTSTKPTASERSEPTTTEDSKITSTVFYGESAIEGFDATPLSMSNSSSSSDSSSSSSSPTSSPHPVTSSLPSLSTEETDWVTSLGPIPEETTENPDYEETDEDYGDKPRRILSRKTIFKLFKKSRDKKRNEEIATMLQTTLNNITETDWESYFGQYQREDIFSAVVDHFVPLLDEIQPTKQEDLRVQQHALTFNRFTVDELQEMAPVIEWRYLISELLGKNITNEDRIYVTHPAYLVQLNHLLSALDLWVVHYGIVALYAYDVLRELIVSPSDMDRGDFCLQATKNVFGDVLSHMYLHHVGHKTINDIRKHSMTIIDNLKEEAKDSVNEASWLSDEDRIEALKKIDGLQAEVGALDKHWDIAYVNETHEDVTLNWKDSFLQNVMVIYRVFREEVYSLYHENVDRDTLIWSFAIQPFIVNAFHMPSTNTIVFPEAFFQKPYYIRKAPEYVNYGSAGTSIAHEIFHGLDFTGTLFDHRGVMSKPFSNETRRHLQNTVDCYHKLLSNSFYEEINFGGTFVSMEIDSSTTLNENLADIEGIRHAFRAYKRWEAQNYREPRLPAVNLNPDQLFFVSAVRPFCAVIPDLAKIFLMEMDEHLPNGMRMNAMLMNTPEFARVFNCQPGSRMVVNETCPVF
ncbi:LOW QUALITY PROTEIN: uncharacterized protein [Macrobrachium rosenbergii]|uniref:LOW QUALITY PROTEIN: uncharacterized protein n=1 Tax=Macrobrachium rosenbergii TaxID=79674 RepID=UPI0034D5472D